MKDDRYWRDAAQAAALSRAATDKAAAVDPAEAATRRNAAVIAILRQLADRMERDELLADHIEQAAEIYEAAPERAADGTLWAVHRPTGRAVVQVFYHDPARLALVPEGAYIAEPIAPTEWGA